jgi:hypothetical protein
MLQIPIIGQGSDHEAGVGKGSASPHLGSHPDRFHQFLRRSACPLSGFGMSLDAIGALGDMSDGDGNQLLRLGIESAITEYLATERIECRLGVRRELPALVRQLGRWFRI